MSEWWFNAVSATEKNIRNIRNIKILGTLDAKVTIINVKVCNVCVNRKVNVNLFIRSLTPEARGVGPFQL